MDVDEEGGEGGGSSVNGGSVSGGSGTVVGKEVLAKDGNSEPPTTPPRTPPANQLLAMLDQLSPVQKMALTKQLIETGALSIEDAPRSQEGQGQGVPRSQLSQGIAVAVSSQQGQHSSDVARSQSASGSQFVSRSQQQGQDVSRSQSTAGSQFISLRSQQQGQDVLRSQSTSGSQFISRSQQQGQDVSRSQQVPPGSTGSAQPSLVQRFVQQPLQQQLPHTAVLSSGFLSPPQGSQMVGASRPTIRLITQTASGHKVS
jgi:hypothetical protein